jgi:hypothetical protein
VTKWKCLSTVAVFGASLLIGTSIGQAAPISGAAFQAARTQQASPLTEVQYRHRRAVRRHSYYRHHHSRHHHSDAGALAAGAIFGLAAGAIAANAAASNNAVAYCSSRFRSYDPASGTYLGYDGYRHPCP